MSKKTLLVIPSRLDAVRLPRKPLAMIHGIPMIVRVWQQAVLSNVGRVIVACCGQEIAEIIREKGGEAVLTDPNLPSGSDRVVAALHQIDQAGIYETVINLQGDLPTIAADDIQKVIVPLENQDVDISTLATPITDLQEINNPNIVKIALGAWKGMGKEECARALYFSRQAIPANAKTFYHHIGIYAYQRQALERYMALPPSLLEQTEKLEQLRAMEAGMRIDVIKVNQSPISVDTEEDLTKVNIFLEKIR